MKKRRSAQLHFILNYKQIIRTLTYAFSHHDGQSKGGGPSLLVLVAIFPHLLIAERHHG